MLDEFMLFSHRNRKRYNLELFLKPRSYLPAFWAGKITRNVSALHTSRGGYFDPQLLAVLGCSMRMSSQRKSEPWPCLRYSRLLSADQHWQEFKIGRFNILMMLSSASSTYDEFWVFVSAGGTFKEEKSNVSEHAADTQEVQGFWVICMSKN